MGETSYHSDVVIIGAGIAGICTALEMSGSHQKVLILERGSPEALGGLARLSFGGVFLVETREQRWFGIEDSSELALRDWLTTAEFSESDVWPRRWAECYTELCHDYVYRWLRKHSVRFFPVVHWVERGLFAPGNSVPRFHMVWGAGEGLVKSLIKSLEPQVADGSVTIKFNHCVTRLNEQNGRVTSADGNDEAAGQPFSVQADQFVIASGGFGGDLAKVREHWFQPWGPPPETILNGAHPTTDGMMLDAAQRLNAVVTNLEKMWLYAAGVHHPHPHFAGHGISLVPPKSALWLNFRGERIGPLPLVAGYDTRFLVEQICRQPHQYSWQILNRKIAVKELAVSGSEFNDAIRDRKLLKFLWTLLRGNHQLVDQLSSECPDFVVANSLDELAAGMNRLHGTADVDPKLLHEVVRSYDAAIERGKALHNDEQLRRLAHLRQYRGDRVRTCRFQKIEERAAMPLIAIREFILTRKSMGGIQTNLQGQVLRQSGPEQQEVIEGLYAVGEAAGFGGGGIHGLRALEGTFLGTSILTGRLAARSIRGIVT